MFRSSRLARAAVLVGWVFAFGCAQIVGDDYEIVGHSGGNVGAGPGDCESNSNGDCLSCRSCAISGPCGSEYQACNQDFDCGSLASCVFPCQDQMCLDDCFNFYPGSDAPVFQDLFYCVDAACSCTCLTGPCS
jgi:hypothetical protein